MRIGRALSWTAERFPNRIAVGGPAPLTWRQWDARTNQLARTLADLGGRTGERVVLLLGNGEQLASAHLACQKLGVMSTPLNTRNEPEEIAYCAADAAPVLVLTDDSTVRFAEPVRDSMLASGRQVRFGHFGTDAPDGAVDVAALSANQPDTALDVAVTDDDPSIMLYTSGTTGRPKGVPRTQHNEASAALAHILQVGWEPGEVTLGVMPMYHTMGVRTLLATVLLGGTWVPAATAGPADAGPALTDFGVTSLYLVPSVYFGLLRAGVFNDRTKVRKLSYAGAPMTPALCEELGEVLRPDRFVNHYGSTEVFTFSFHTDQLAKPGCAGRPGLFGRLRLVRADAEATVGPSDQVGPGEQGEIIVDAGADEAFSGYWHRPDADAKSLRDGWYFTGDLGQFDDDGDLWVAGRVDDMINTGGENVYPGEIEDALARCPLVRSAAVAGLPDPRWGQAVTAFVVPATDTGDRDARSDAGGQDGQDALAASIDNWLRTQSGLAGYKRPKKVVLVEEIPRSAVGKILRRKLVAGDYQTLQSPSSSAGPAS